MTIIPLASDFEMSLGTIYEFMRRAVDGSVIPIFVDYSNNRVIVGGTTSLGSGAPLQIQSGDLEITTSGKGLIMKDDGGSGHTCRITPTFDSATNNWVLTFTTVS